MASWTSSPTPKLPWAQGGQATAQWEVILDLLAHRLDPKTLATASCVSRSWNSVLSSDHLWSPLCLAHYPSIVPYTTGVGGPSSSVSPRRMFSLLRTSSARRPRSPCVPRIALSDLVFAVDVFDRIDNVPVLSVSKPGDEVFNVCDGVFLFDVEVEGGAKAAAAADAGREMRVVWNVVMKKGWEGGFMMMDRVGKGTAVGVGGGHCDLWFSETLPVAACCPKAVGGLVGGGVVAELGLGFRSNREGEGRTMEKVRLGLMTASECRYLGVDDGLLFLQPFLLPSAF